MITRRKYYKYVIKITLVEHRLENIGTILKISKFKTIHKNVS